MNEEERAIDIIIPIYNAYEDLVQCVASIWKYTDLKKNRLILVNDKSPDKRVEEYLNRIAGGTILVHQSEQNGGFSASVNIGMGFSDQNDVVLLNSDTIVTRNWLDKIRTCAYSEEMIGTVTPLSNSATLASVPIFGQDNPIPDGVTIDEMAEIVERCSFRDYPQITVAVGFCMFIKRKVIAEIGLFDAETFGRGYGEENDYCCRCEMMGYKHVLCDDTFIYHKGTASFLNDQKKALMDEHVRILEGRYPSGMRNNHLFCMRNPHQYIRDNLVMYLNLHNGKKNVLYVLHDDFRDGALNNVGGTQLHVRDLTQQLIHKFNIFVLAKDQNSFRLSVYTEEAETMYQFADASVSSYPLFRDQKQKILFENIISAFSIDLVHVHHISKLSLEIYYAAKKMNIPIITTIHDFYMLCPTCFLYNINKEFCSGKDDALCDRCLAGIGIYQGNAYISKWQTEMQNALRLAEALVFPSASARDVFAKWYQLDNAQIIIAHGMGDGIEGSMSGDQPSSRGQINYTIEVMDLLEHHVVAGWAFVQDRDNRSIRVFIQIWKDGTMLLETQARKCYRADVDDVFGGNGNYVYSGFEAHVLKEKLPVGTVDVKIVLVGEQDVLAESAVHEAELAHTVCGIGARVAFIGGLADIKGSAEAYEMVKSAPDIQWFVFGGIDPREELAGYTAENLHKYGFYNRSELMDLLQVYKIDLVCILSKCSETFCYTLSEAWKAGVPVVGYDIGAVGERIRNQGGGVALPISTAPTVIVEQIRDICASDERQKEYRGQIQRMSMKTDAEMAEEYAVLYNQLMREDACYLDHIEARLIFQARTDRMLGGDINA